jgi:hypothetical protein
MAALEQWSTEWTSEAQRAPTLLETALANPNNLAKMAAAVECLERLGIVVPDDKAKRP